MNRARLIATALLAATVAGSAFAQDTLTRADVRAQTLAAEAAGDIPRGDLDVLHGETDTRPAAGAASTATRTRVKAELAQAVAAGDVPVGDEGRTLAEIDPGRYPQPAPAAGLTRAQVRAELAVALRDGDIPVGDEGRTDAEIHPQRYAAARAADEGASVRLATR